MGSESNPGYGMAMAAFCPTAADIDHSALGLRGPPDDVRLHPEPLGYPGTVRRSERLSNKPRPDYTSLGGKTRTFPRFAMGSNPMPNADTRSPSPGVPQQHVLPASVDESALGAAISRRGDGVTIGTRSGVPVSIVTQGWNGINLKETGEERVRKDLERVESPVFQREIDIASNRSNSVDLEICNAQDIEPRSIAENTHVLSSSEEVGVMDQLVTRGPLGGNGQIKTAILTRPPTTTHTRSLSEPRPSSKMIDQMNAEPRISFYRPILKPTNAMPMRSRADLSSQANPTRGLMHPPTLNLDLRDNAAPTVYNGEWVQHHVQPISAVQTNPSVHGQSYETYPAQPPPWMLRAPDDTQTFYRYGDSNTLPSNRTGEAATALVGWSLPWNTGMNQSRVGAQHYDFGRNAEKLSGLNGLEPKPNPTELMQKSLAPVVPMTSVATQTTPTDENPKAPPPTTSATNEKPSTTASDRPKQWIKLGSYNGRTAVEAFIRKFEICAKNNGWSSEERLNQLLCSLTEPANQILWEFESASVVTWTDLVERLRSRYGSADQTALYQAQLNARKQKDGEDFGTLVQDIRRLMTLAYPGPPSSLSENIAIRAFVDALADRELVLKIKEREPETLDKAYKLAIRLDGYKRAELDQSDHNERRHGRVKTVKEVDPVTDAILRRLDYLEQNAKAPPMPQPYGRNRQAPPFRRTETREPSDFSRRGPNGQGGGRPVRKCYECRSPDHLARACPYRQPAPTEMTTEPTQTEAANLRYISGDEQCILTSDDPRKIGDGCDRHGK